jgi:hypothetical protein
MCRIRRRSVEGTAVSRRIPRGLGLGARLALLTGALAAPPAVSAQTPSAPASPPSDWRASATLLSRVEMWRYFEPRPGGGDPDYAFLGIRLRGDVRGRWGRVEPALAVQGVSLAALPTGSTGPGALGTGALYYEQSGRRQNVAELYIKVATLRMARALPATDVQVGRMGYTSGAETPSGVPKIEAVKRQRLDARLVGEFEWSIVQRSFDGVRVDVTRPRWQATAVGFMPTQGGFAAPAGTTIREIQVAGATLSSRPSAASGAAATQLQGFGWYYRDRRAVAQRPDNTARAAPAGVDVDVTTAGAVVLGAYPAGPGQVDLFGWAAIQGGRWYGDSHRAYALALETGYQWPAAPWRPWLRAGVFQASGDEDSGDAEHGTFFPMLPTVRRFAQTTLYSTMNLRDLFVQVQARPRPALGLRVDARRLDLASAADLWYAGSGATRARDAGFGFSGRPANGSRRLGTSVEAGADWTITRRFSVNGFVARVFGGPVVTGTFAGDASWFGYVENVIAIGAR